MNLYKRKVLIQFAQSFCEAGCSFFSALNSNADKTPTQTIMDLIEFSVVYFPYEKCKSLIAGLKDELTKNRDVSVKGANENFIDSSTFTEEFLNTQLEILLNRETTTKKNVLHWVKNSKVF